MRVLKLALVLAAAALAAACPPPPDGDAGPADAGTTPTDAGDRDGGVDAGAGYDAGPLVPTDNSCTDVTPAALPDGGPALAPFAAATVLDQPQFDQVLVSPDGATALFSSATSFQTFVVDLESFAATVLPPGDDLDPRGAYNARYAPDGATVVFWTSFNNRTETWATATDLLSPAVLLNPGAGQLQAFSPDGELVVLSVYSENARVVELATGDDVSIANSSQAQLARFTPDGARLVVYTPTNLLLYDVAAGDTSVMANGYPIIGTLTDTHVAVLRDNVLSDIELDAPGDATVIASDIQMQATGGDGSVYLRPVGGGPLSVWRRGDIPRELSSDVPTDFRVAPDGDTLLYLRGETPDVELRALDTTGARDAPWLLTDNPLRDLDAVAAGLARGEPDVFLVRELLPSGREVVRRTLDGCTDEVLVGVAVVCTTRPMFRGLASDVFVFRDGCDGELTTAGNGLTAHALNLEVDEMLPLPGTDRVLVRSENALVIAGVGVTPVTPPPPPSCGAPGGDGGVVGRTYTGDVEVSTLRQAVTLRAGGYTRIEGDLDVYNLGGLEELDLSCLEEITGALIISSVFGTAHVDLSALRAVDRLLIQYNSSITSIDLAALETVTNDVSVLYNSGITDCDAQGWFQGVTTGSLDIQGNLPCVDAGP